VANGDVFQTTIDRGVRRWRGQGARGARRRACSQLCRWHGHWLLNGRRCVLKPATNTALRAWHTGAAPARRVGCPPIRRASRERPRARLCRCSSIAIVSSRRSALSAWPATRKGARAWMVLSASKRGTAHAPARVHTFSAATSPSSFATRCSSAVVLLADAETIDPSDSPSKSAERQMSWCKK